MSPHTIRGSCHACKETLPRAAFHRCPFCRAPIERITAPSSIICRRCNATVPRLHVGRCPACALADQRAPAPILKRKHIR